MQRGEVWTLSGGGYVGKPRPAVIVQDDRFDATSSVTVCAFTADATDAPLFRLATEPDGHPKTRLGECVGRLSAPDVVRLNRAIAVFLGLA